MSDDNHDDRKELGKYRKLYTEKTGKSGPARDRFAHFMLRRFGELENVRESYAKEWAKDWIRGDHFHRADKESMQVLYDVYHEQLEASGLAPALVPPEVGGDE